MRGRQFSLRISLFYVTSFLVLGIFVPFFPLWLQARGLTSREIAIAMAAPMAARIFIVPIMTLAADGMGDRRLIVAVCSLAALAALGVMPAASGFTALLLLAILYTGAMTPVTPIVEAIAVEGAARLAIDYGRMRLWGSLSFIGGSIGAGVLLDAVTAAGIIWLLVGACALLVFSVVLLPGRARQRNMPRPGAAALARFGAALFAAPQFLLFTAAAGAVMSSHAVFYAFGSLHWRTLGFDGPTIGLLWAVGVAAEVALFAFAAKLIAPIPAPLLLLAGAAGGVLRWTVTAIDPPLGLLLPLQTLHALSFAADPSRRHEVPAIGGAGAFREFRPGALCRGGVGAVHGHRALRGGPALRGVRRASLPRHGAPVRGRRFLRPGSQSALAGRAAGRARWKRDLTPGEKPAQGVFGGPLGLANRPAMAEPLRVHHLHEPPQNHVLVLGGGADRINADARRRDHPGVYPGGSRRAQNRACNESDNPPTNHPSPPQNSSTNSVRPLSENRPGTRR